MRNLKTKYKDKQAKIRKEEVKKFCSAFLINSPDLTKGKKTFNLGKVKNKSPIFSPSLQTGQNKQDKTPKREVNF